MSKHRLLTRLAPNKKMEIPLLILFGLFIGLTVYIFILSRAPSYLSDDPETCTNCHIMAPQYATWNHSSHRENAHCNDCHVPHNNVVNKYYFKAKDGLRHASVFSLRNEPQVIFIKEESMKVVQDNCIRCHNTLLTDSKLLAWTDHFHSERSERNCWDCHREVPHGRVNSLSSTPYARVPLAPSPVPDWLKKLTKNK